MKTQSQNPARLNHLAALQRLVKAARENADCDFLLVTNAPDGYGAVLFAANPDGLAMAVASFLRNENQAAMLAAMQPPVTAININDLATGSSDSRPVFVIHENSTYVVTEIDTTRPEVFTLKAMELLDDVATTADTLRTMGNVRGQQIKRSLCLAAADALTPVIVAPAVGEEGGENEPKD